MMSSAMVLIEVDGLFLTVSRKDDFNDFGLPGGKVDPGESFMQYATRVMKTPQGYNGINSMYDCGVFHEHLDNMIVEVEDLVKVKPYK